MSVILDLFRKISEREKEHGYACLCCGTELFDYPKRKVCNDCEQELILTDEQNCPKCGRKTLSAGVCLTCKKNMPTFTQAFSPFSYDGLAAQLVNRLKNGSPKLATYLGERMAKTFLSRYDKEDTEFLILPVPLGRQRLLERGYNQAELLAESIMKTLNGAGKTVRAVFNALIKTREDAAQKKLGFQDRAKNALGSFHLHERKIFQGKSVLLVDDILTTGATACACAKLLFGAGAKAVYLLTAASAPERK